MQFRFCTECSFEERDDNFEINRAYHQGIGRKTCPNCGSWLWSLVVDEDKYMEITDWDENGISGMNLEKILERSIQVIKRRSLLSQIDKGEHKVNEE